MEDFFEPWRPSAASVHLERGFPTATLFSPQTPPLALPGTAAEAHTVLPLFGAASTSGTTAGGGGGGGGAGGSPGRDDVTALDVADCVCHVGGPVWALAWCPADVGLPAAGAAGPSGSSRGASGGTAHYFAVGCHPLHSRHNLVGRPVSGPSLIQLWEVTPPPEAAPSGAQQAQQPQGPPEAPPLQLPRLALGIAHDGCLAWNCQWCPDAGLADALEASAPGPPGTLPRLGLLAAALGDGSLRVWAVPQPRALPGEGRHHAAAANGGSLANGSSRGTGGGSSSEALIVNLDPVLVITAEQLGGSMPATIDWLPAKPHDLLLVGCWDGHVAIIKLLPSEARPPNPYQLGAAAAAQQAQQGVPEGGGGGSAPSGPSAAGAGWEVLSFFPAEPLAVRAARWAPPAACGATPDMLHRHLFAAAGYEGTISIWDDRDPFQPLYKQLLQIGGVLGLAWTAAPFGLVAALEDASLRGLPIDTHTILENRSYRLHHVTWRGPNLGAMWALDVHPTLQVVAYGGEDGEVGVFNANYTQDRRNRPGHHPVAGIAKLEDVLVIKSQAGMVADKKHGVYTGKVVERLPQMQKAQVPHEQQAIHRVAWHPGAGAAGGAWLASGGAAGLVRLQWLR